MCLFLGIHFEKDKGQHILKNPLIINSMIEKVIRSLYIIIMHKCVCVCACVIMHVCTGCTETNRCSAGSWSRNWEHDCQAT